MDTIIDLVFSNQIMQWVVIVVLSVITIMFFILFIQYNIDRSKGRHAKFLWFEVNAVQPPSKVSEEPKVSNTTINGKNINTGTNFGEIGDKYTGLKQREVTQEDINFLQKEIQRFSTENAGKLINSHITLGFPGCKETTNLANQVYALLQQMGFKHIVPMNLQTYGVIGRKFGVSNAPDNSLMVEIFPADNVE